MTKRHIATILAAAGGVLALWSGRFVVAPVSLHAQQTACLHDGSETDAQEARRIAAIQVARNVNTAESRVSFSGVYQPLAGLQPSTGQPMVAPEGFALALSTDGKSYAFSLKDKTDACRFTIFSDQDGLIYQGGPLR